MVYGVSVPQWKVFLEVVNSIRFASLTKRYGLLGKDLPSLDEADSFLAALPHFFGEPLGNGYIHLQLLIFKLRRDFSFGVVLSIVDSPLLLSFGSLATP